MPIVLERRTHYGLRKEIIPLDVGNEYTIFVSDSLVGDTMAPHIRSTIAIVDENTISNRTYNVPVIYGERRTSTVPIEHVYSHQDINSAHFGVDVGCWGKLKGYGRQEFRWRA